MTTKEPNYDGFKCFTCGENLDVCECNTPDVEYNHCYIEEKKNVNEKDYN